jgi:hypothetical protein
MYYNETLYILVVLINQIIYLQKKKQMRGGEQKKIKSIKKKLCTK